MQMFHGRAVGFHENGPKYHGEILEAIRRQAEDCDALQSFFICNSMGGGTGSGVGSYLLGLLADEYPEVYRFANIVFPGEDDDVVTCPYNSTLALSQLNAHADCVLPVENQALFNIVSKVQKISRTGKVQESSAISGEAQKKQTFDTVNNIIANLLLNITSSMRFEGTLNVDINEIVMNLVPFPRLKYLTSSMAPLYQYSDLKLEARRFDSWALYNQLIEALIRCLMMHFPRTLNC